MTNTTGSESAGQAAAAEGATAQRTASRAGRVLAYWRWQKITELLEAAGQLALFDRSGRSTGPDQTEDRDDGQP